MREIFVLFYYHVVARVCSLKLGSILLLEGKVQMF